MRIYVNVMEILIEQEVMRQISAQSALKGLDTIAVTTYALNRVPPLYACSAYGLSEQIHRGYQQYQASIEQAVQWAISAVRKAPRHVSEPLTQRVYERLLSHLRSAQSLGQLTPAHLLKLAEGWLFDEPSPPGLASKPIGPVERPVTLAPNSEGCSSEGGYAAIAPRESPERGAMFAAGIR